MVSAWMFHFYCSFRRMLNYELYEKSRWFSYHFICFKPGFCEWKQVSQSDKELIILIPEVAIVDEGIKSVWVLINFKKETKT